jgi:hypothetical protein
MVLCFAVAVKLRTKLSLAEWRTRLGAATDLGGMALSWDAAGPTTVVGEFRGPVFRLHTPKYYQNSFSPFFYGQLSSVDGGSVLEGSFRLHPFVRLFMVFWFAFLIIFGLAAIIVPAAHNPAGGDHRRWYFAGLALLAVVGVGLVQIGKWLGNSEQEVIRSFLKSTLEAAAE